MDQEKERKRKRCGREESDKERREGRKERQQETREGKRGSRSLTAEHPSSPRRCWSRGGGQLWRSSSPSVQSIGEVGPSEGEEEDERPFLYSSMSRMETSRAAWSSCSCSFNTSSRKEHDGPEETRRSQRESGGVKTSQEEEVIEHEYYKFKNICFSFASTIKFKQKMGLNLNSI